MRAQQATTWFGHPKGLTILFLTQTWETFSYGGMRALLVYYLTKTIGLSPERAAAIYGIFIFFVHMTPLAGGVIADRFLGFRRSVVLGGLIMAFGHLLMTREELVYPALATIALGTGFFLPSLPIQVGQLYDDSDERRDRAFSIYYLGINLGAVFAPIACGTLGERYGWSYGFGLAGIGMLLGLAVYLLGRKHLPPEPPRRRQRAAHRIEASDRNRIALMLGPVAIVVLFNAVYEQFGSTIALWADDGVDRSFHVAGWQGTVPMTWFQSLNPILVIALTPLLTWMWKRQARRGAEPGTARKMMIGACFVAFAYFQAGLAATGPGPSAAASLVAYFVLLTIGELFLLPVGLGLFVRLAPRGFAALAVGCWYVSSSVGGFLAGALGGFWSSFGAGRFFLFCAALALLSAVLLRLFDPLLERNGRA